MAKDKSIEDVKPVEEEKPAKEEKPVEEVKPVGRRPIKDIVKELKQRGIRFSETAPYDQLANLLNPPKESLPKRKVQKIVPCEQVEMPHIAEVPVGISTTQDHERRITAVEIALGIKKVETVEID